MEDINKLYNVVLPTARNELRKWGCSNTNFDDIYHDAFDIILKKQKGKGEDFRVNSWYITQMCKHLWFKEHKRRDQYEIREDTDLIHVEESKTNDARTFLLLKHLKNLSPECQKILTLFSLNYSEQKISKVLNLEGAKAVNNHKHYCKEKLRGLIKNDPLYKEIDG